MAFLQWRLEPKDASGWPSSVNAFPSVAVIDIGSNSIKILVAQRTSEGKLISQFYKTLDARISAGISKAEPRLSDEGVTRGLAAVRELLTDAATFTPVKTILVATSAVRDATNGAEFRQCIFSETGYGVRVLSGDEEANLIGRGLTCDPALAGLRDFYLFDLGGGSLECLSFRDRTISQGISLQLGCVRLTERCVADPKEPFTTEARLRVSELAREHFAKSGFAFDLPANAVTIGTGGTLTTARAILAARAGLKLEDISSTVTVSQLRELLDLIGSVDLEARRKIPGVPFGRADVMPAALATFIALAEFGGISAFINSLYNLRWGVADEAI
jgi:exopolyphosphatase/guanosine-5'-triphosphate,3'-diphosphate pyrophosphatase